MYLIARLNLAINKRSEKFWYGIDDRVRMGEYEKESGRMGEYKEFRRVWMVGNWGIFVSLRSWVKYGSNMEGVGNVGEEWESVLRYGGGVGDVGRIGKMWGEVWKSLWSECGGCEEVGESVFGCGRCGKMWGSPHTILHLPHTLHTHPTHLPTLTQHFSPTLT